MKCPNCRNQIIQRSDNGFKLRVKGKIEWIGDVCKSQCYWCGESIRINLPIDLQKALMNERFYIRHD